jgi:hypothetical protein
MFSRYEEFLKLFNQVHRASIDCRENPLRYHYAKLNKELRDVDAIKEDFEKKLLEEVDIFIKNYSDEYTEMLNTHNSLIKSINIKETEKLNLYSSLFTCTN